MDFKLSPEHEMLRKTVRQFAEDVLRPSVAQRDEDERYDKEVFYQMGRLGLTGIPAEAEYGGAGMDYIAYAIAVEEIARVDASTADTLSAHYSLGVDPIRKHGTAEQKSRYLRAVVEGTKQAAFGLTEPNAGSDVMAMATKAESDGDDWVLNGRKIFITNAEAADVYVVFARTGPPELKTRAFSAFIVEKGTPGFSFGKFERKMGLRGTQNCDLIFEDCRIPKDNLLGKEGEGFKMAMQTLDGGRIGIAAQAVGIAQGAFEAARDYTKERQQFGRPISANQSIRFKLADMAMEIQSARLLTYMAFFVKDRACGTGSYCCTEAIMLIAQ
jgi:butyryl-CoA dehydrogenase